MTRTYRVPHTKQEPGTVLVTMTVMLSLSQEVWSPSKVGPVGPGLQYCTPPLGGRGQP